MLRLKEPKTIIVLLALVQVLAASYFLNIENFYGVDSFIFLLSGLGIGICLMYLPKISIAKPRDILNRQLLIKLFVVALLLPLSYQLARHIMDHTLLDYHDADMLPVMKVMGQRFWQGHWGQVYKPIPDIWNGEKPIYLPAMWFPFSLALVFHFDMRWITVCGIWLSVIICMVPTWRIKWGALVLVIALTTLLAWLHFDEDNSVIELSEEGVVLFYYSLLAAAIFMGRSWLLGIAVALCFMSRYSFIGWLPFAIVICIMRKEYVFLLKTMAFSAVTMLFLLLPFGLETLFYHLHLHTEYVGQAKKVWQDNPEFFYEGLGMAKFFGPTRIILLHSILETGSFLAPILFLFIYRKKINSSPNMLLAGLQIAITFFYNFIDVPYLYLFYTPVFVSLTIAAWVL